ncbi:MAG: DUF2284 domain-containing protein [Clostridia bacterium]|nr:DUF2284 domain-containing protein [Clostridia bacterium]
MTGDAGAEEYLFLNIDEDTMRELGFESFEEIPVDKVHFSPKVREMCAENRCGRYGTSWACPPGIGTFEECVARCKRYAKAFVFSTSYELEDSFDFEGMMDGHAHFSAASKELRDRLEGDFLMLSVEGCGRCKSCTYPDAPCRFPETLLGSLEGYGIFVNDLAREAGIPYRKGAYSVSYFGAVFYGEREADPSGGEATEDGRAGEVSV